MPLELERIYEALTTCDLFVAIGTSGQVYPAAGFVETVRAAGSAHTLELNLEPSATGSLFADNATAPRPNSYPASSRSCLREADGNGPARSAALRVRGMGPAAL